jgi:hypothetical protein
MRARLVVRVPQWLRLRVQRLIPQADKRGSPQMIAGLLRPMIADGPDPSISPAPAAALLRSAAISS